MHAHDGVAATSTDGRRAREVEEGDGGGTTTTTARTTTTAAPVTASAATAAAITSNITFDAPPQWRGYPQVGMHCEQGRRKTMEDSHVLAEVAGAAGRCGEPIQVWAVFDGHGGDEVAKLCEELLVPTLEATEDFWSADDDTVLVALNAAFAAMDAEVVAAATAAGWIAGSTGVVCILRGLARLFVANLGDSEASLGVRLRNSGKGGTATAATAAAEGGGGEGAGPFGSMVVSMRHKPADASEKKRIQAAGGHVVFGRINGALAVSRAFGDKDFKLPLSGTKASLVTCEAFTHCYHLEPVHEFLVLACDGLWDVFTHEETAAAVGGARQAGKSAQEVAEKMVEVALAKGSTDNISVIVAYFPLLEESEPAGWRQKTVKGMKSKLAHAAFHLKGKKHTDEKKHDSVTRD